MGLVIPLVKLDSKKNFLFLNRNVIFLKLTLDLNPKVVSSSYFITLDYPLFYEKRETSMHSKRSSIDRESFCK